jgi:hypothetical protein
VFDEAILAVLNKPKVKKSSCVLLWTKILFKKKCFIFWPVFMTKSDKTKYCVQLVKKAWIEIIFLSIFTLFLFIRVYMKRVY